MVKLTDTRRYLALGDSYTYGEGVAAGERWPEQLATALRRESIDVGEVRTVARTGWTTQELAEGMEAESLQAPHGLVSLQIGVNDQYRGQDVDTYRASFRTLLTRAVALAGDRARHVLVVSIPDWGHTPFARGQGRDGARVARELDAYNAAAHEETMRCGARWTDITPQSRRHTAGWIGTDGLHPTAQQYAAWVELILPAARAVFAPS